MMGSLRMLVPAGTTNYIKNPSFRYDTTGWTANGSTLLRTLERARFGFAALKVTTNGIANQEGTYYRINWLSGIQTPLTGSIYLRGSGRVRIRLTDNLGANYASQPVFLTDTRWMRLSVTGRCSGGDDVRLVIETADNSPKALTFYLDAAQVEPHEYMTTYCDGDQPGCFWNILRHGSLSTRSPYTRDGGRFIELAGCDREEQDLYMTVLSGFGVAPIVNNIQSYADSPGSYYQNSKIQDRVITILFHARNSSGNSSRSLEKLHQLRKTLFDIIRPDRTAGDEEFLLEYTDGEFPIYVKARYESGLGGEWDIRNFWKQSFPVRFLAVSPLLFDDNYETSALLFRDRITTNRIVGRFDEQWRSMNGGMNGNVLDFVIGKRGEIYAVGTFTQSNVGYGTITTNCIAYWDGDRWNSVGGGVTIGTSIQAIAIAPNGDIYVAGDFQQLGAVPANRVAKWNGTTWSALGTGLNSLAYAIRIAPNGDVYIGGAFTTAGGALASGCARWDGGTWHSLGTQGGLNATVFSIDISPDGTQVVLGGMFTDEYSNPGALVINRVALYDPTFNQFLEMGDGFDLTVYKILYLPDGLVYAAGEFTLTGTDVALYVAYWDGSAWHQIGGGADDTVYGLDVDQYGNILASGNFLRIGNESASGVALYNGSSWVGLDIDILGNAYTAKRDSAGNIFVATQQTLADIARITTLNVLGTAEVSPVLYIVGPCRFRWVENQTTHKRIYADIDILNGEEVVIDFGEGKIESTIRGSLAFAISPGSDLRSWTLLPGENRISAFMTDDIQATLRIYYAPRFWSADSTAGG